LVTGWSRCSLELDPTNHNATMMLDALR